MAGAGNGNRLVRFGKWGYGGSECTAETQVMSGESGSIGEPRREFEPATDVIGNEAI